MLSCLLEQIWIGIDYFLLNFIATFGSVLALQVTAGLQAVDCSHQHVGSHLLQAQCCVALSQPKKQSNRWSSA